MKHLTLNLKALASDRRIDIVLFLEDGEQTLASITQFLAVSPATAYFHIAKLLREGYIQRRRAGGNTYYDLTPAFRKSKVYRHILRNGRKTNFEFSLNL